MTPERNEQWKQEVGARLADFRVIIRGKTQEAMAEDMGLSQSRWANWESGKRLLDLAIAVDMVERYNVTLDWLYVGRTGTLPHDIVQRLMSANRNVRRVHSHG